jgi:electron transport complex protein RnfB
VNTTALADLLNDALPQTQCTRCGYPDCRGYAEAIAEGEAGINQCPPGGADGIQRLARLSGQPALPLNAEHGREGPRLLAVIDEAWCIGCTLCIKACPVDCIIGAAKQMHTVIDDLCTGCELCLPVCPVDCISLVPVSGERSGWAAWSEEEAQRARNRYDAHRERTAQQEHDDEMRLRSAQPGATAGEPESKRATIAALLARARARAASAGAEAGARALAGDGTEPGGEPV